MICHNLMIAINFNESFPVEGTIMDAGYLSVCFFPCLSSPLTIYGTSFLLPGYFERQNPRWLIDTDRQN